MRPKLGLTTCLAAALITAVVLFAACGASGEDAGLQGTFPDGSDFDLANYEGKVVLLEFLSTTCPHCAHSSQEIEPVYQELRDRGFEIVGIALNSATPEMVNRFAARNNLTFPIAIGEEISTRAFLQYPDDQILYVPRLVFLGRDGTIREHYSGGDAFITGDEQENVRQLATKLLAE